LPIEFTEALEALSSQPSKIKIADINLTHYSNFNEGVMPWNMLHQTGDKLSRSIRTFSSTLTELTLCGTHFSPEIFWPASKEERIPEWPHLKRFTIKTSQETADGKYLLLERDERYPPHIGRDIPTELENPDAMELMIENNPPLQILVDMALWPTYRFRMRPDGNLLTEYALAIAQAARRMPKLEILSFFVYTYTFDSRAPLGFIFIADREMNGPRTDWFFDCCAQQLLGWTQPEEASRVWREKCGDTLEESVITEEGEDADRVCRRRFRDGRQVDQECYIDHFGRKWGLFQS
jgi:hypothetical protein